MKTLTKVTILGIVGNDPDLKQAKSGLPIASFPVATMTKKKDPNGEPFEATLWHNVVCFGKTAENVSKTVTKGSKIYIDGTIDYQEYKDSQGTSKIATKIICNDFSVVSKSEYKQSQEQLESRGNKRHTDDLFLNDDIPF